jgi:hypothetical protein
MAARDTLERVVRAGFSLLTTTRVRRAGQALLVVGLIFLALRLRATWHGGRIAPDRVFWPAAVGAFAAAVLTVIAAGLAWLNLLRLLGAPGGRSVVPVYLVAQFAKYVPGGVWQFAGRAALARDVGIPARTTTVSMTVELVSALAAALVLALLALGAGGVAAACAVVVLVAVAARHSWPRLRRLPRAAVGGLFLYLPSVALSGVALWLVSRAILPRTGGSVVFYVGAWAASWAVGLVAIFAPGGIGVREAVVVALLRRHVGTADATVVAAASRLVVTAGDAAAAAIGAALRRRRRLLHVAAAVGAGDA